MYPFDLIVPFEDVQPYANIDLPITFRAHIEVRGERRWTADMYEMQSRQDGSWVRVSPYHHAHAMCDGFTCSDTGYGLIEAAILAEMPEQAELARWDAGTAGQQAA